MIRAVIFDCFGVLTTDGWLPFKRRQFGADPGLESQATDLNKQYNSGLLTHEEFLYEIAALAGVEVPAARSAIENNVASGELFEYIRTRLKPGYKVGLLSNAGGDWLSDLFSPEQVAVFDAVGLSYQSGFVKPDERAYRDIAEKLGLQTEECVFIDDQERHCAGARDAGMQAIVYQDYEQCMSELETMLPSDAPASDLA